MAPKKSIQRTASQETRVEAATRVLPELFETIMVKFIPANQQQEYHKFVNTVRYKYPQIFVGEEVERSIENSKLFKASERKKRREANEQKRRVEVEEKIQNSFVSRLKFITDSNEYTTPTGNTEQDYGKVTTLYEMERTLSNNFVQNKFYMGGFLLSLKQLLKEQFFSFLEQKGCPISKPDIYFAIQLHEVIQNKQRLLFSNLPLRFFRKNLKIIASLPNEKFAM